MTENKKNTNQHSQTQEQPPTLSIQDLSLVVQIIDLAFSRGAFRGSEASDVGNVYEKITKFVNYTIQSQEEAEENNKKE